jgi:hypothetical protein
MSSWEYKVIKLTVAGGDLDEANYEEFLNARGSEGWELISAKFADTRAMRYGGMFIFKRPRIQ